MLSGLARLILKMGGWTLEGSVPDVPKAVIIAAPHTSNWDAFWALTYVVATRNSVHFFAKHSLFWFPLGTLLSRLGGIPLDRSEATSAVQQAVDMFKSQESFYFALAPEGTRSLANGWKSGFYRIAREAAVPVFLGFIDYRNKRIGMQTRLDLSGDIDADLEICAEFYAAIEGRRPEKTSPVRIQKQ